MPCDFTVFDADELVKLLLSLVTMLTLNTNQHINSILTEYLHLLISNLTYGVFFILLDRFFGHDCISFTEAGIYRSCSRFGRSGATLQNSDGAGAIPI